MTPPPGAAPDRRWLAAVVLGGQGRYAAAATLLGGLLADRTVPTALAAHAAVTLGAHRRQLGGHAAARRWDALGLRLAVAACRDGRDARPGACASLAGPGAGPSAAGSRAGLDAGSARIDALVGLAADALGALDLTGARRLLAAADRLLAEVPPGLPAPAAGAAVPRPRAAPGSPVPGFRVPGPPLPGFVAPGFVAPGSGVAGSPVPASQTWRPRIRAHWVLAELALLEGRAAEAVAPAEAALAAARGAGALRHVLKSRIVLAVARAAADPASVPDAVDELTTARDEAADHRLLPLVWPAALAAADLLRHADPQAESGMRHTAMHTVSVLKGYADPVGRRLMGESVWVPRVAVGSLTAPFGLSSPT
ncbi:hypothetical protein [Pseudonocardia sp.]|uniref:hypothetical protein n=1 Tax=Pseudonocardia sp. TaxID=60912 RepID=UPI003D11A84A